MIFSINVFETFKGINIITNNVKLKLQSSLPVPKSIFNVR